MSGIAVFSTLTMLGMVWKDLDFRVVLLLTNG